MLRLLSRCYAKAQAVAAGAKKFLTFAKRFLMFAFIFSFDYLGYRPVADLALVLSIEFRDEPVMSDKFYTNPSSDAAAQ